MALTEQLIADFQDTFDDTAVIIDPARLDKYLIEERGLYESRSRIVFRPESTEALARGVKLCHAAGVAMVPQGGNTGLVGGAVCDEQCVLVSLERMNRIREIDATNFTVTVEAGCILETVQKVVAAEGGLFPLSLGAEGSCTIGGNIASNAGGVNVLKYGNTRDLVLGLEVVLADGEIWHGLRPLIKDNSGYSLKNVFVGSEGTLGFITAAVLKTFPAPTQTYTAFCAIDSVEAALELLSLARRQTGDSVSAFELMSRFSLEIVCEHTGRTDPFDDAFPWYVLFEVSSSSSGAGLREDCERILETAFEAELLTDAVLADSLEQAHKLWALRESTPEAQKKAGGSIKHDVSVPVSRVATFINQANAAVAGYDPAIRICAFGHVGDGNVHYNLTQPEGADKQAFLGHWNALNDVVHGIVQELGGSISAEHGIGLLKVDEIEGYRSSVERRLMIAIKNAIDPDNRLNPGKLVRFEG